MEGQQDYRLDRDTLITTIDRRRDNIYRLAYAYMKNRYDADDVYQTVFESFIRNNPQFKNEEHEKAWFIRTTINACKNIFSSGWNRKVTMFEEDEWKKIEDGNIENVDTSEKSEKLLELVMQLPPKYRVVVHLFYYEDYSVNEIAEMLGITISNVTTRLKRARAKLKDELVRDSEKNEWEADVYGIK